MNLFRWLRLQWDRALAAVAVAAGSVMLLVGWIHISGTAFVSKQLPYLASEGLGGTFLLGVGATLWLSADLRDQWRELRLLQADRRTERAQARDDAGWPEAEPVLVRS